MALAITAMPTPAETPATTATGVVLAAALDGGGGVEKDGDTVGVSVDVGDTEGVGSGVTLDVGDTEEEGVAVKGRSKE